MTGMKLLLILTCLSISLTAYAVHKKNGETCLADTDCAGGVCLNLGEQKELSAMGACESWICRFFLRILPPIPWFPVCEGKVCTQTCQTDWDCNGHASCRPDNQGRNVCFYYSSQEQQCK